MKDINWSLIAVALILAVILGLLLFALSTQAQEAQVTSVHVTPEMSQAAIQEVINATQKGSTVVFDDGTYQIDGNLTLKCGVTYQGVDTIVGLIVGLGGCGGVHWSLTT